MKQGNYRERFDESNFPVKKIPGNHREEFARKLEERFSQNRFFNRRFWWVAASFVVVVFSGLLLFINNKPIAETDDFAVKLQTAEKHYLKSIEMEWEQFVATTKDQQLIARYQEKLNDLDRVYEELTELYEKDKQNFEIVEALIQNLKFRLDLIREIQEHLKVLEKNNNYGETV